MDSAPNVQDKDSGTPTQEKAQDAEKHLTPPVLSVPQQPPPPQTATATSVVMGPPGSQEQESSLPLKTAQPLVPTAASSSKGVQPIEPTQQALTAPGLSLPSPPPPPPSTANATLQSNVSTPMGNSGLNQMTPEQIQYMQYYQQYCYQYYYQYMAYQQQLQQQQQQQHQVQQQQQRTRHYNQEENYELLEKENTDPDASRSIWVGNIPNGATEMEMRHEFEPYGAIEQIKFVNGKNCCFVIFARLGGAIAAHQARPTVRGRPVKLGWGKTPEELLAPQHACKVLYIGNLPPNTTESELAAEFGSKYPVRRCNILNTKNVGFVEFETIEQATEMKEMLNNSIFHGSQLRINFGKEPEEKQPPTLPSRLLSRSKVLPPPAAEPPADAEEKGAIDRFASLVVGRGSAIEALGEKRAETEPKMAFLKEGHPHHAYYLWKVFELFAKKEHIPCTSQPQKPVQNTAACTDVKFAVAALVGSENSISRDDAIEFCEMLMKMESTVNSITAGKNWVTSRSENMPVIAKIIEICIGQADSFKRKLSILYLVNDILLHGLRSRYAGCTADVFSVGVRGVLGALAATAARGECTENVNKLIELFSLWKEKGIYDEKFIESLKDEARKAAAVRRRQWDDVGEL